MGQCGKQDSATTRLTQNTKQVDQQTSTTPKKQVIPVPSLASLEEMRTPSFEDLTRGMYSTEERPKWGNVESKMQQERGFEASPNRTPFADVN